MSKKPTRSATAGAALPGSPADQPLSRVEWVRPDTLLANDYNPNHMPPREWALLKVSILEQGWTQPIVVAADGRTIIDGFHRCTLALRDPDVAARAGGFVPIVRCLELSAEQARAATVRHNRARGNHGIDPMAAIVRGLLANGISRERIMEQFGMEAEEVDRLSEVRGAPERIGAPSGALGAAWNPEKSSAPKRRDDKPARRRAHAGRGEDPAD